MNMAMFWVLTLVGVLICSAGGYFIAYTICQNLWVEKVPQSKLVAFTSVFVVTFVTLGFFFVMASTLVFGR